MTAGRTSIKLTYSGIERSIHAWSKILQISHVTLWRWHKMKLLSEATIKAFLRERQRRQDMQELRKKFKVPKYLYRRRLGKGMDPVQAATQPKSRRKTWKEVRL